MAVLANRMLFSTLCFSYQHKDSLIWQIFTFSLKRLLVFHLDCIKFSHILSFTEILKYMCIALRYSVYTSNIYAEVWSDHKISDRREGLAAAPPAGLMLSAYQSAPSSAQLVQSCLAVVQQHHCRDRTEVLVAEREGGIRRKDTRTGWLLWANTTPAFPIQSQGDIAVTSFSSGECFITR